METGAGCPLAIPCRVSSLPSPCAMPTAGQGRPSSCPARVHAFPLLRLGRASSSPRPDLPLASRVCACQASRIFAPDFPLEEAVFTSVRPSVYASVRLSGIHPSLSFCLSICLYFFVIKKLFFPCLELQPTRLCFLENESALADGMGSDGVTNVFRKEKLQNCLWRHPGGVQGRRPQRTRLPGHGPDTTARGSRGRRARGSEPGKGSGRGVSPLDTGVSHTGHRGLPAGHRGLHAGHRGLPAGHMSLCAGHRGPCWTLGSPRWTQGSPCWTQGSPRWTQGSVCWTQGSPRWTHESLCWTQGSPCWTRGSPCWTQESPCWTQGSPTLDTGVSHIGHRGLYAGHRGLPAGHRGPPAGHRGLHAGHRSLHAGHRGLPTGHRGLRHWTQGSLCWTQGSPPLDTGVSLLDTGVSPLDTGVSLLDTGVSPLDTGVSLLDTGVSLLDTGVSLLDTGVSLLDTGVSTLDAGVSCCGRRGLHAGCLEEELRQFPPPPAGSRLRSAGSGSSRGLCWIESQLGDPGGALGSWLWISTSSHLGGEPVDGGPLSLSLPLCNSASQINRENL
ncbi:torsin-4A isoform X1 [Oryctolagus cuniculus]|uniref:torsin-4A isoform X1 n=1 Tax=Oryctolagus cuniculus TaxID=9986 RepID=UPI00387A1851